MSVNIRINAINQATGDTPTMPSCSNCGFDILRFRFEWIKDEEAKNKGFCDTQCEKKFNSLSEPILKYETLNK